MKNIWHLIPRKQWACDKNLFHLHDDQNVWINYWIDCEHSEGVDSLSVENQKCRKFVFNETKSNDHFEFDSTRNMSLTPPYGFVAVFLLSSVEIISCAHFFWTNWIIRRNHWQNADISTDNVINSKPYSPLRSKQKITLNLLPTWKNLYIYLKFAPLETRKTEK